MYILKNAFISIVRNKGRNILIGVIILVISLSSTVALAINNTASRLISSYESAYEKEVTISFNRESMMKGADFSNEEGKDKAKEKFSNVSSYTVDDIKKFADSDYIKRFYRKVDECLAEGWKENENDPGNYGADFERALLRRIFNEYQAFVYFEDP